MKPYFFLICFLIQSGAFFCQEKSKQKFKAGDKISESFTAYKDAEIKFNIPTTPENFFLLLYKFGSIDGVKDNYDSVYAVVHHIYRLNKFFRPGTKTKSKITCLIFVKNIDENAKKLKSQIQAWNNAISDSMVSTERVSFNFKRPWEILFVNDSLQKSTGILSAGKLTVISAEGVLLASSTLKAFKFGEKKGSIKGKLLTENKGKKVPVPNVVVSLYKTGNENEPDSALTNDYGDFELATPDDKAEYSIVVKSHPPEINTLILATQSGQEISKLKKTKRGFEYKLIETDVILLKEMEEEDISLKFNKFEASQKNDLKVTENILYGLGKYNIEEDSKETLDKVVKILRDNPMVKLEVISHTDAQGDDKANQLLSEKRSNSVIDYFNSRGIDKSRLKAIGKGETEIRNRCTNGVDCSDKEHEFNRRTEFKFMKG